jgi:hypothetical protein
MSSSAVAAPLAQQQLLLLCCRRPPRVLLQLAPACPYWRKPAALLAAPCLLLCLLIQQAVRRKDVQLCGNAKGRGKQQVQHRYPSGGYSSSMKHEIRCSGTPSIRMLHSMGKLCAETPQDAVILSMHTANCCPHKPDIPMPHFWQHACVTVPCLEDDTGTWS